jgi:hypothetical protein
MKNIFILFFSFFIFTTFSISSDQEYSNLENAFSRLNLQKEMEEDVNMSDLNSNYFEYESTLSDIEMEELKESTFYRDNYKEILKRITILEKYHRILVEKEKITLSTKGNMAESFFQEINNISNMILDPHFPDFMRGSINHKISGSSLKDFFKLD